LIDASKPDESSTESGQMRTSRKKLGLRRLAAVAAAAKSDSASKRAARVRRLLVLIVATRSTHHLRPTHRRGSARKPADQLVIRVR